MKLLILFNVDVSSFLHAVEDCHNFVTHTVISGALRGSTQFQAIEELVENGG